MSGPYKAAARASVKTAVAQDYAHTLEAMASEIRRLANERDRWKRASNRVATNVLLVAAERDRLLSALLPLAKVNPSPHWSDAEWTAYENAREVLGLNGGEG